MERVKRVGKVVRKLEVELSLSTAWSANSLQPLEQGLARGVDQRSVVGLDHPHARAHDPGELSSSWNTSAPSSGAACGIRSAGTHTVTDALERPAFFCTSRT